MITYSLQFQRRASNQNHRLHNKHKRTSMMIPILKPHVWHYVATTNNYVVFFVGVRFYFDKKLVRLCIDLAVTTLITRPNSYPVCPFILLHN